MTRMATAGGVSIYNGMTSLCSLNKTFSEVKGIPLLIFCFCFRNFERKVFYTTYYGSTFPPFFQWFNRIMYPVDCELYNNLLVSIISNCKAYLPVRYKEELL